jgi:hypothetical protein
MPGLFTDDDGYFRSPVMAAAHATLVQGGTTTPEREAARMIRDGGRSGQIARAWMKRNGLTEDDLEWDPRDRPRPSGQPGEEREP